MSKYALASGLKGFRTDSLRVRVTRRESGMVWVVTADLADAGTSLVLDAAQVAPIHPEYDAAVRHRDGLVSLDVPTATWCARSEQACPSCGNFSPDGTGCSQSCRDDLNPDMP